MTMKIFLLANFILLIAFTFSCEDSFERKISTYNSESSHNAGMDCFSCHQKGGAGEYVFGVAGTGFQKDSTLPYPNTTIQLYTGVHGSGKLKYELEADAYGNFYTSKNIHFGDGLFPAITSDNGTSYMMEPITTGSCNGCHGVTTDYLRAK